MRHSPRFKFSRTLGCPGEGPEADIAADTVPVVVGTAPSPLRAVHDSVFAVILRCLGWRELLLMRRVCARACRFISLADIVARMVAELGLCLTLYHCVVAPPEICRILITKYEVPRAWLLSTLVFCMIHHYNDVATVLLHHLSLPRHCRYDHVMCNFNFGDYDWFRDFLVRTSPAADLPLSHILLLSAACVSNNVAMFLTCLTWSSRPGMFGSPLCAVAVIYYLK